MRTTRGWGSSGHFTGFPQVGRVVAAAPRATHDGRVTPTDVRCAACRRDADVAALRPDLEPFWPSRRGHAYDEFCRTAR
jgi:hypothetical protein